MHYSNTHIQPKNRYKSQIIYGGFIGIEIDSTYYIYNQPNNENTNIKEVGFTKRGATIYGKDVCPRKQVDHDRNG